LGDQEKDPEAGCPGFEFLKELLKKADFAMVGESGDRKGEVVQVRNN